MKNLKKLRKAKGLSQFDLAIRTGIHTQTISKFENEGIPPNLQRIKLLADTLGVTIDDLIS